MGKVKEAADVKGRWNDDRHTFITDLAESAKPRMKHIAFGSSTGSFESWTDAAESAKNALTWEGL